MQAAIVHVRDPFRPHVNRSARRIQRRTRIDTLLRQQGLIAGRGRNMRRLSNFVVARGPDDYLMQEQWSRCINDGELITVIALPAGGGLRTIALVVVAVVAAWVTGGASGALTAGSFGATAAGAGVAIAGSLLVNAVLPLPKPPTGSVDQQSQAYGIGAKGNTARLLQSIPVMYGRFNRTPDYAAQPYTEFFNNEQILYSLLAVTQGAIAIEQIRIGDTPIENFGEVQYEVVPPGGIVTLFPDNVVTSDAVQGLELKRQSEGGDWVGPFAANPPGSATKQIAVDIGFSQGIYRINSDGKEKTAIARFSVDAQPINDAGAALGPWQSVLDMSIERDDKKPGQFTSYQLTMPSEGRWQIRARGYDTYQGNGTTVNTITWAGMRSYLPSKRTYGDITLLAVRIKATNNLNSSTAKAINVTATRLLPVWNGASWSAPQPTRSPAWAIADILRNTTYGRGWADNRINLAGLLTLAQTWATRGDTFDGVFDTKVSLWDALTTVARVGRAVPMYYAGVVDIVRDEPKPLATLMLTPDNIVAGSLTIDYAYRMPDAPDHVVVTYIDSTTWQSQTVTCALATSPKLNPKNITLQGAVSRDQAFREGIYMAACDRDQRKIISLTTEMEGYIPRYGDLVSLSHDVPAWGESGRVEGYDPDTGVITTSEPTQWFVGQQHYVRLRNRNGSVNGPFRVIKGNGDYSLVLQGLTQAQMDSIYVSDGYSEESTLYQFGPANKESQDCLVIKAVPDGTGKVALTLVNYAYSVHVAENDVTVPPPGSGSLLIDQPEAPAVGGVGVQPDPDSQTVWLYVNPVPGAVAYEFQISYDGGVTWMVVGIGPSNSLRATIPGGAWIVRARAVGRGGINGPWNQNPVTVPGAPPSIGALTNLVATPMVMSILLTWQLPERLKLIGADAVEVWFGPTPNRGQAAPLATVALPANSYTLSNLKAGVELYFWARVRGTDTGNYGPEIGPIHGESSSDAAQILDYLTGKIGSTQLAQELLSKINSIDDLQPYLNAPAWEQGKAYAVGTIVGDGDRLYRAVQAVPTTGPKPGTDPAYWRDVGARVQTAWGLAGAVSDVNIRVDKMGDTVTATASKTDSVFAQLNPKEAGSLTGATDGTAGNWTTMPTAGWHSWTVAQVQGDMALGQRIDTLSASVGGYAAQIQTIQQAQASLDGRVSASYTMKTEVAANGLRYLAGIAIGVDYSGGTVTSQVLVNAGTFAVFDASSGQAVARFPFVVQGGQVFMDQAFIANASITEAKIANGAITNAKISGAIYSDAVDATGQPLWKFDKSGMAVFRNQQGDGRSELDGNGFRFYDANGVRRVAMGRW
ncbi:host specificity factor TipJ family phage tail protein [Luteibacter sp.]|uniref:host specificity factor TipJ family phage tail protein n=1 Tax=Luteibacter sp. TaxID=1886636 RepID=UPI0025BEF687|nr:host specificity factor TipJ family phage tail protein [Luteibacter sp.]